MSTGIKKSSERKSFIGSLTGSSSRTSSAKAKKGLASSTAATDESSAATATKTEVYREERAAPSDVSPVEMQIGELSLKFENGGWTYTDKTGEVMTITAPAPPPATSQADLKEMERLREENKAVHQEVRSGQAPTSSSGRLHSRLTSPDAVWTCARAQNNLLKYKVELLVDMVTLANLDCDKFEDELAQFGKGQS